MLPSVLSLECARNAVAASNQTQSSLSSRMPADFRDPHYISQFHRQANHGRPTGPSLRAELQAHPAELSREERPALRVRSEFWPQIIRKLPAPGPSSPSPLQLFPNIASPGKCQWLSCHAELQSRFISRPVLLAVCSSPPTPRHPLSRVRPRTGCRPHRRVLRHGAQVEIHEARCLHKDGRRGEDQDYVGRHRDHRGTARRLLAGVGRMERLPHRGHPPGADRGQGQRYGGVCARLMTYTR